MTDKDGFYTQESYFFDALKEMISSKLIEKVYEQYNWPKIETTIESEPCPLVVENQETG